MTPPWRRVCAALMLFAMVPLAGAQTEARAARPHIVVFLVDDLGWQDTQVPFDVCRSALNERYRTPQMERLAASGMKFTQAYVHAICSPTRISLMTGLHPARHRVTSWTLHPGVATDQPHPRLSPPAWNVNGLCPVQGTQRTFTARALPAYLQAAGYRTIHVGKAHFAAIGTPAADPRALGFDVNIAGHAAGAPGSYRAADQFASRGGRGTVWDVPGLEAYHGGDVDLTEALTREAVREVREALDREQPFFLYLAHYAVHTPIMADPRFENQQEGLHPTEAAYASMVEAMDASLGIVLDLLQERGIERETVVLFLSDNGGLSAVGRGGTAHRHNAPLSSGKGSAREGGVRVPMLVRWPGVTPPASVCDQPVVVEDWFRSVLELAGVSPPDGELSGCDGRSFVPLLRGKDRPPRPILFHQPNVWISAPGPGIGPHSALREGPWKLIYYHDPERVPKIELFHLDVDLGETANLAVTHPERTIALLDLLGAELRRFDAQMPVDLRSGRPIPYPSSREFRE